LRIVGDIPIQMFWCGVKDPGENFWRRWVRHFISFWLKSYLVAIHTYCMDLAKRILSTYLFFTSVFQFFKNTCMLSIRIQFEHLHLVHAWESYAYAHHLHTKCMHMLSIHFQKNTSKSFGSYNYASIRLQILRLCWAFTYKLYAYAQCKCTICKCMLSICIHIMPKTPWAYNYNFLIEIAQEIVSKILFWFILMGPWWHKKNFFRP
jgi:hypothetical protein